jgi:hypothetical protein
MQNIESMRSVKDMKGLESINDQLDFPQSVGNENPDFREEITHEYCEFDMLLDDSPDQAVPMDIFRNVEISSQYLDVPVGRSASEPLPMAINPAKLSRDFDASQDSKDTHVEMAHSAAEAVSSCRWSS